MVASVGGYQIMLGNDKDFLATRVSYKLDLRGPSVDRSDGLLDVAGCGGGGLPAPGRGECDMALAGGVARPVPAAHRLPVRGGHDPVARRTLPTVRRASRRAPRRAGAGVVVLKRLSRRHGRPRHHPRRHSRRRPSTMTARQGRLHRAEHRGPDRGDRDRAGAGRCPARTIASRRTARARRWATRSKSPR